jgi:rhodanese-related sulfurtransferase
MKKDEILETARGRAQAGNLPYAGAMTPAEAYSLLQLDPGVKIVDVRTNAERDWVGKVAIDPAQSAAVQWNLYPESQRNPAFLEELKTHAGDGGVLLFLCRSGVRSRHAAQHATENGYTECYDVLEGFEGEKDAAGHRKTVNGWCKAGLPWSGA